MTSIYIYIEMPFPFFLFPYYKGNKKNGMKKNSKFIW